MGASKRTNASEIAGFAVGVGLVAVATLGVYWRFWQPGHAWWLWGPGSFAIGALVGGAYATLRRGRA